MSKTKEERGWRLLSTDELAAKLLATYQHIADLEAKNARLQARVEEEHGEVLRLDSERCAVVDAAQGTIREREGYKALVERWLSHDTGCGYGPSRYRQSDGCDCGLTEARAALAATPELTTR